MIYAKIENGIVTQILEPHHDTFVFRCKHIFKTFSLWLRIDELDPQPQVGWSYDPNTGFSP